MLREGTTAFGRESSNLSPGTKTCTKCQRDLPLDSFPPNSARDPSPRPQCRECAAARSREYRRKNRDAVREKEKARNALRKLSRADARVAQIDGPFRETAHERIDAGPFQEWVGGRLARGESYEVLALGSGVSPRSLRRAHREQVQVSLSLVDRVLMANDCMLWEVYDD